MAGDGASSVWQNLFARRHREDGAADAPVDNGKDEELPDDELSDWNVQA